MEELEHIYAECPDCGEVTLHEVLKGRIGKASLEATLRCQECQRVHAEIIKQPETMLVPVIVSDGDESYRLSVDLESDDLLAVGDEFFVDEMYVKITALETKDGRRPAKVPAPELATIWAKRFDRLRLKVSINNVHKTLSRQLEAAPDEEFAIGDILNFGSDMAVIHAIKAKGRMIHHGAVEARKIVRIYCKPMRITRA
ncbi:MAG: hypothetical protein PWQ88_515 [Candidatus Methanomethylophilaceae archaeon]|nr:hypothetical protein [Candidatus Methanomethylophilaceae archaeon]MDI3541415.1 hypothetical protein [Candidatus Methanomethylophilaceae archaeon]